MPFPSFGRNKSDAKQSDGTNPGRHRTPLRDQEQEEVPDNDLEDYLAALAPDSDPESTGAGRRFGSAEVHQLRLPLAANEQLREVAAYRNTSPMALAQEWVMQRLEWEIQQIRES
ncbi:hypothetical protein [Actinokineospora bangkokensis]|uniref:Uncharacterized protein n=1 Tax=Actinokineospora bangkokensis TaxID=1193682 RepID=A0A1Q9LFK2_9PSEU|nr:hypothetical protein [Actinokineospora bangkokensis]OLR90811.1 hypothetical protein BJP25_30030 [Actinokineospora bangkokensis]